MKREQSAALIHAGAAIAAILLVAGLVGWTRLNQQKAARQAEQAAREAEQTAMEAAQSAKDVEEPEDIYEAILQNLVDAGALKQRWDSGERGPKITAEIMALKERQDLHSVELDRDLDRKKKERSLQSQQQMAGADEAAAGHHAREMQAEGAEKPETADLTHQEMPKTGVEPARP